MKQALTLGSLSAANISSALLFQWLLLTMLGPGVETDALFAGMTIPQLFATIISASMTHVLVPVFAGEHRNEQRRDAWSLLILYGMIFVAIAFALVLTAQWWAPLTVLGFSAQAKSLTISLAQISAIGMVFTGINAVQTALAFAQRRYIWADMAPMIANLTALALLIPLLPRYGAIAAAWIAVVRLLLQSLLLFWGMGMPSKPNFETPAIGLAWQRLRPLILGASYYKMDPLVDRFLLSSMVPGTLSLFYVAQQLYGAASQVLVKALAVPAITRLSIANKAGDNTTFAKDLRRTSLIMTGVGASLIVCLILVGQPVLSLMMEHGKFHAGDSRLLWLILVLSCGQFIWGALGALVAGAFYALGDTRTPTWLGSISFTISIGVKIAMFSYFGVYGLAIAVSIYFSISIAMMLSSLYWRGALSEASTHREASKTPHEKHI
jgi:putative peptidoglycan lipid II flippase